MTGCVNKCYFKLILNQMKRKILVRLQEHSIYDTGRRSRKKHEDLPRGIYEVVDDSG